MSEDVIRVSFKKNESKLYDDILSECNIVGQSAWMKLAAKEKLDREKNKSIPSVQSNIPVSIKQNNYTLPIMNELADILKL